MELLNNYWVLGSAAIFGIIAITAVLAIAFRVVVSTNDVHIVQSSKRTVSYGKDQTAGNTYYAWPSWVPVIGVKTIQLPVSVFDIDLNNYAAYDKGRVPFVIDIMGFFRITDSNMAAQRVSSFPELKTQLEGILQGACRSILASSEIEEILEGRRQFGERFTSEVDHNLEAWGVQTVKCIELMDIRDATQSQVIQNIMAKKKSLIERESRVEVAENLRAAREAEIAAKRQVDLSEQQAEQTVGQRTAEKEQVVGIAREKAQQEIKAQSKVTAERDMEVKRINRIRAAEIERDAQIVAAEQEKQKTIIAAEATKSQKVTVAEGDLEAAKLEAVGIEAKGKAEGTAQQAVLMAPVNSQITLAKEIGNNDGYQKYLLGVREIEKNEVVGVAQSKALEDAQIKVIANSGDVSSGVKSVMELLTAKGGTQLAAMAEAFVQSETGAKLVEKINGVTGKH